MSTVILACEHGRSIELDTRRTALACIDFQVDFVEQGGRSGSVGLPVDRLQAAVPAAERALNTARRAGLFVCHTREAYAPDLSDLNPFRRRYDRVIGTPGPLGRFLVRGERGTEIIDAVKPIEGEPTVDKAGFSAFYGTALDDMLHERNIETLLLTGVTTQCCVASTLRDAVDRGYACVLLQDAAAAFDPLDHEATIQVIYSENHNFGWVSDSLRLAAALP